MSHTLVLNADYTPVSAMPPQAIHWQRAITAVMEHSLKPLHFYENWQIHSPNLNVMVPSVVIKSDKYISVKRNVSECYRNAFIRDEYVCQYCGKVTSRPTADHVHPKTKGGSSKLSNIATACSSCNNKKGDSIIMPKNKPYVPTYYELVRKARQYPVYVPHMSWGKYIGWPEDLIRIVEPHGMPGYVPIST